MQAEIQRGTAQAQAYLEGSKSYSELLEQHKEQTAMYYQALHANDPNAAAHIYQKLQKTHSEAEELHQRLTHLRQQVLSNSIPYECLEDYIFSG